MSDSNTTVNAKRVIAQVNITRLQAEIAIVIFVLLLLASGMYIVALSAPSCSRKKAYMRVCDGIIIVMLLATFMSIYLYGKAVSTDVQLVLASLPPQSRQDYMRNNLHSWHNKFLAFKIFFLVMAMGMAGLNQYLTFINTELPLFIRELCLTFVCGMLAGWVQVHLQGKCKCPRTHLWNIIKMGFASALIYVIFEISGINSLLAKSPAPSSVSGATPAPASSSCGLQLTPSDVRSKIEIETILLIASLSTSLFLTTFIVIAGNALAYSQFEDIERCYTATTIVAQPSGTVETAPVTSSLTTSLGTRVLTNILPSAKTVSFGKAMGIFVFEWGVWAVLMNIAYVYIRINRNGGVNGGGVHSVDAEFMTELGLLTAKFWGVGLLLGIMDTERNEQNCAPLYPVRSSRA